MTLRNSPLDLSRCVVFAGGHHRADDQLDTISKLLTPCGDEAQGVEGGVAVISRMLPAAEEMGGSHKQVLYADAQDFARRVQDGWRIGKRECDNGFLLLASKEDRQFAISMVRAGSSVISAPLHI